MSAKTPKIVADVAFDNQSASLSAQTLFTPSADGIFRVSTYIECAPPSGTNTSGNATATVGWDDGVSIPSSQSRNAGQTDYNNDTSANPGSAEIVLRAKSGTNITLAVSSALNPAVPYNVYAVVEEL